MRPTIALLPGLLCDAQVWAGQHVDLAHLATVAVADFSKESSIEAMAAKALSEIAGPLVAIGHSMGGRVALEMVRQGKERIVGLGLLNTGIHVRREGEVEKRAELVRLAYDSGMGALADRWLPGMLDPARKDDQVLLASMRSMVMRATPEQHERQIQALLNRPDPRGFLRDIACPTLALVGRQDQWSPLAQHEEIAALIPGTKLAIIENAGHMAPMERPAETSAALCRWLRDDLLH
ncbi:alpha/beta hydrolase [Bradyrhizobium manausense]|uniref:alpha/beta fold hydrolase n=1 Tax=Bradyrhizobium TaxID=374 RepID=UPI001BA9DEA8|nr:MULTISPECIES: alpha/beta hydrolase [Bradyrhizobium]MBR0827915.1 alpha/beta hydrolase [Bradyrhizobium manausense]UVO32788.1 alpha/beta hydrolase [Bradyrhizobium arachidis]